MLHTTLGIVKKYEVSWHGYTIKKRYSKAKLYMTNIQPLESQMSRGILQ